MNEIEIKKALPENASALLAYLRQIGSESDNLSFGAEGLPLSVEDEQRYLQSVLSNGRSVCLLAWKNGKIIGDASLQVLPRRASHRAELGISVLKEEWHTGVGSQLMEALIAHAKISGIEIINLEVRSDNSHAIHLYEKFGFTRIGTSPAFFRVGNQYVDFELMVLDLR